MKISLNWLKNYIDLSESPEVISKLLTDTGLEVEGLENIEQITVAGTSLLLGNIFDEIGFNIVDDELFKQLVIARLCFPASKLKTTDFLSKYHFLSVEAHHIYRYLDKLHSSQKELVQDISYAHSLKILNNEI